MVFLTLNESSKAQEETKVAACMQKASSTHLKTGAIHGKRFAVRQAMQEVAVECIEVDRNQNCRYSANGCISSEAFEVQKSLECASVRGGGSLTSDVLYESGSLRASRPAP